MYRYAVLGGTGATGSAIITQLLCEGSPGTLHIYARNADRLSSKIPQLGPHLVSTFRAKDGGGLHEVQANAVPEGSALSPQVKLYIGDMFNTDLISACLADVDVVFQTIAANVSEPDITIAQDVARVCVESISLNRKLSPEPASYIPPTILFLSSASCAPTLCESQGKLAHWFLHDLALYYIYNDLEIAQRYLELPEHRWIPNVIVCPNGLTEGEPVGHTISREPSNVGMLTYTDLGAGMLAIARDKEEWQGKMVQASGKRMPDNPKIGGLARYILIGLLCRFARPLWNLGRWAGWW